MVCLWVETPPPGVVKAAPLEASSATLGHRGDLQLPSVGDCEFARLTLEACHAVNIVSTTLMPHIIMTATNRSTRSLIEKLKYIHRNSVKRKLVEMPEEWKWNAIATTPVERTLKCRLSHGVTSLFFQSSSRVNPQLPTEGNCGPPASSNG